MPDAHLGKGATVGSVIPTLGAIIPAAVGVDIGCGMIAVRTQYVGQGTAPGPEARCARTSSGPSRCPPATTTGRSTATAEPRIAELEELAARPGSDPAQYVAKWELQLGSLGSGNHFIEVCAG